jgi:hypothetical protein
MPENGTYDPAGDYMVALPGQTVAVSGGTILTASVDDFQFRYLTGFINLAVADITAAGITSGDIVESVKISAGGASTPVLSGAFSLNLTDGAMTFSSESNEVTVTCPAGLTLGGLDLWAVVNPFALTDAADEITFIVETATHTIEKSIAVAQLGGNFAIAAGGIKTFGMTIDDSCTITEKPLDQGTDGNISWVLSANGTLTFSGTGDMRADYHPMNPTAGVPKWLTPANAAATTKVVFESGITSIASYCLGGSTTNVLKNVAEIVIPSTVTTINDNYALGGATAITSLTLPSSVETIGTNAFDGCTGLVSLTLQEGLITIKNNAFKGTKLVTLTIPNSVTSIGNLGGITTLESATLGTGLTTLGANAFQKSTALRAITIPANITAIGNYAFDGCTVLATVNMPSGLLTIGNYAFRACPAIENITLPSTLTSLGTYVFQNCTQLKGIVIPDSVPTIGNYAFSGCSALESATIGSGVTAINTNAFASCTNLGNVTVLATVPPTLNTSNNFNVNTNDTLTVLAGTLAAYQAATAWANAFTTIVEAQ